MRISDEDKLDELLVKWAEARQQRVNLSVADLCADCPHLLSELIQRTEAIEFLRPFVEMDDDTAEDFLHLPDFSTVNLRREETRLPAVDVTLDQFYRRLAESGLIDSNDIEKIRETYPGLDALSLAHRLVSGKRLTPFQATALLQASDLPLILDRYLILDQIGAGGMGTVFKALHQPMDRIVALKILPKSAVDSGEKVKRFQREVKAAAKLHHPNIVTAFDAREDQGIHFLVMEMIEGQDLAKLVRKQGPLSAASAVNCISQAARGLDHAHKLGIVHRDIKPANLLLDRKGTVKILDMGLARIENIGADGEQHAFQELTQSGMIMGTLAYLAPEQALDTRNADARSDMYSLGCTLYFLLTGRSMFPEDTMMKALLAHREREIPALDHDRVPAELEVVFRRMVAKKPEDRFQSMSKLLDALEQLTPEDVAIEPPPGIVPTSPTVDETTATLDAGRNAVLTVPVRSQPPRKRNWSIFAVCLLGLAGLGGAWAAGILLRVETNAGTILLEIDQPELIGAEVTVDGERRIMIQAGDDQEKIEVMADEKTHTLKVTKGGFEAFVKDFTVKAGKEQTIRVRLEPAKGAPLVTSGTPPRNWALEFDGVDDYVDLSSLKLDHSKPITFEAVVQPYDNKRQVSSDYVDNVSPIFMENTLLGTPDKAAFILIFDNHNQGYWFACQPPSKAIYVLHKQNARHVAAVWTGTEMKLFCDGQSVFDGGHDVITQTSDISLPAALGRDYYSQHKMLRYFFGRLDEVRISSVVRYTENFSVEKRFEPDEHTVALYHFDEGQGDTLTDSSGNGRHGKIIGAKWVPVDDGLTDTRAK